MSKKTTIIAAIIVIVIVGSYLALRQIQARNKAAAQGIYQTSEVARGELTATVGATGIVRANQTAILVWQTSGTVEQVDVAVGDFVQTDQVLALLKNTSLPQSIILAQADLQNAQKALDDLNSSAKNASTGAMHDISQYAQAVRDAQYQLDNFNIPTNQVGLNTMDALDTMEQKLNQARQAFEPYKYSPVENSTRKDLKKALDEAQSDYNAAVRRLELEYALQVAKDNLEKARQDYDKWKNGPQAGDVAAAQARIDAANAAIDMARLSTPFSGTLSEVSVKPGDLVAPGNIAFRLDDLTHLLVDVQVSEVDINRVKQGQDVLLTFDAIPSKEYHGVVKEVAFVGSSTQDVVDFTVTVELSDVDDNVKPGMTAAVNIVVNQLKDVLLVPNRAVRVIQGNRVVYILIDGKPEPVKITLGASSDTSSEVSAGDIKIGDLVVLNPPVVFEQNGPPPFVQR